MSKRHDLIENNVLILVELQNKNTSTEANETFKKENLRFICQNHFQNTKFVCFFAAFTFEFEQGITLPTFCLNGHVYQQKKKTKRTFNLKMILTYIFKF